jgi:PPE-repeat protein
MDFAALPPEINSGRMYAGPGSGPMLAAAATWDGLAVEVSSAASDYRSLISNLTGGPWRGPASASMAAAAAPYVSWMSATAAQAEQAAGQAKAAATAYETAFALTVPPPVIATNRALLTSLIATNVLGQNTPAIAATENHYAEMWAQDAAVMYGYAGSSAAASTLSPFAQPPPTTSAAATAAQAAAVGQTTGATTRTGLAQLISTMPVALQGLAGPASSTSSASGISGIFDLLAGNDGSQTGLAGLFNDLFSSNGLGLNANIWNTIFSSGFYMPGNWLGTMTDLAGLAGAGAAADAAGDAAAGAAAAEGLGSALAGPLGGMGELGGLGNAVSAALGKAASIGPLSVPPSWTAVTPVASPLPAMLGGTPISAPPAVATGVPGMPFTNAAGNHINSAAPRYGFRPTVMSHPPAAG